ncbi:Ppx/GppA phosphatase family protein [Patiriisocius marinus]|uniref:Ppx/GppA phosphatase family protein n=1 Tax=Patiriisocius marinus TaxID=1397112 RepID=UPI00232D04EB|nr:hypothetical protein [Patiriisocius marinus]
MEAANFYYFYKMGFNYNNEKNIAVIELSSSGIKTISASPFHIRKKHDLSKFSDNRKEIFNLFEFIDKNQNLNLKKFKKELLPKIIKHYSLLRNSRRPQAFSIVATGYYRTVNNSEEIISLLKTSIEQLSRGNSFLVKLLSIEEESRLSFMSWYNTYKFSVNEKKIFCVDNINKLIGLNIDIGGSTTEVSLLKNVNNFSNTISLVTEITKISETLSKKENIKSKEINDLMYSIGSSTLDLLSTNFIRNEKIDYCVVSGSNILYREEYSSLNTSKKSGRKNIDIQTTLLKEQLITYRILEQNEKVKIIKHILSLTVLKMILGYIKIEEYYPNQANLRVGCYYEMMTKLRNNEDPYS